jgi:branched-chain amino acid aminotransferase
MSGSGEIWTYYDGAWREGNTRILGAATHATWLGSMVFDGARAFEGVNPDLDLHCARLNASARAFDLEPVLTTEEMIDLALDGLRRFAPGSAVYIRPMLWAEEYGPGVVPAKTDSSAFALCLEAIPMVEPKGFTITTTRFRRPTNETAVTGAKAASLYPNSARMIREAQARGFDNALACDIVGNVAELASANVFMARGGEVFTPIANGTFLSGITRKRVIGLLREAGVTVHEITLTVEDFREADEIFSTGNISKVVPIVGFDDKRYDYGPIARKARALYWDWAHR